MEKQSKKNTAVDLAADLQEKIEEDNPEVEKVWELCMLLLDYSFYNKYDIMYAEANDVVVKARRKISKFSGDRRLKNYLCAAAERDILKVWYNGLDITAIKAKLGEFEKLIDKKYWAQITLEKFIESLSSGRAANIPQAIELYERDLKQIENKLKT